MKKIEHTKCPFCKSIIEVNVEFAKKNGRIFCGNCCKSFAIHIQDEEVETEEEISVPNEESDGWDWGDNF